jgi:membrane-associated phospholipid phosphatase
MPGIQGDQAAGWGGIVLSETDTIPMVRKSHSGGWIVLGWLSLIAIAFTVDRPVAIWVHANGIDAAVRSAWIAKVLKFPGTFYFTLIFTATAVFIRRVRINEAIFILLAGVTSGANWILKWTIGRMRPYKIPGPDQPYPFRFHPFMHGFVGLFQQKDLSFPSGHSCTAFALAMAVALVRPRWAWIFFIVACIVGAERVFENAHYVSEVFAGAGVGAGGALLVYRWMKPKAEGLRGFPVNPTISESASGG